MTGAILTAGLNITMSSEPSSLLLIGLAAVALILIACHRGRNAVF